MHLMENEVSDGITDSYREQARYEAIQTKRYQEGKKYELKPFLLVSGEEVCMLIKDREINLGQLSDLIKTGYIIKRKVQKR